MAANPYQPLSQVLQQAHETIISPHAPLLEPQFQFTANNASYAMNPGQPPTANQLPVPHPYHPPNIYSTPSPPPVNPANIQQPAFTVPHDAFSARNVTMDMLFATINTMNQRLERFDSILNVKLAKLDLIETLSQKFDNFEKSICEIRNEIEKIKEVQNKNSETLEDEEQHHREIEHRVSFLERRNAELDRENYELKEDFLKLQSHSMKYNLIFSGIKQPDGEAENTENVLRTFIEKELEIPDVADIQFQNVHRLKDRRNGKPRSIIARFANFKDHERVLKVVPDKLKNKPDFSVNKQYPAEISDRRKDLLPKFKEFKRQGRNGKMVTINVM